jgi:hypothetical protein
MRVIWATSPALPADRNPSAIAAETAGPQVASWSRASSDFNEVGFGARDGHRRWYVADIQASGLVSFALFFIFPCRQGKCGKKIKNAPSHLNKISFDQ